MKNRIPNPMPAERTAFGLIAWLEQTKITLPLKGVECSFNVCGDVVSVELDQIFQQNSAQPLDCLYTFPLPASAAVYRCEMHVNGRVIRARVEERERARELAREKKAAGHRTALVEMERDNLFTLSLGNVQPGDVIVIRFAYFQTVARLADWASFSIPFCPGIRYIPGTSLLRAPRGRGVTDDTDQVPDASRISPPRIDRLHPDAAYLSVEGTVEHPLDDARDISSPSHPVFIRTAQGLSKVTLADRAAVPDCDFILRWTEVELEAVKPMGWVTRAEADTFALIRLRAPANVATAERYAQDVYFLVDRSGSMNGLKWQKAVEAFRQFVKALGPEDRVWATFFESDFRDLAEQPLPAPAVLADAGVKNLERLGTGGGTELAPALAHLLEKITAHSEGRPASLVVITDGQVGNEQGILKQLASHSQLRVNVFGIDTAINDGFLQKLAAQHHGTACLLSPQDDIVGAVARLGDRLRRPVLTSIRVPDGCELAGQELPDLYAGEVLALPLKLKGARDSDRAAAPGSVLLEGKSSDGKTQTYSFELVKTTAAAVPLLWAKRRIEFLLAKGETNNAITIAKASNLVCEGAAFIAWDEVEKVPVSGPDREVYQPALEAMLCETCPPSQQSEPFVSPFAPASRRARLSAAPGPTDHRPDRQVLLTELEHICNRAGHLEWVAECKRAFEWAIDNSLPQVIQESRRQQLSMLTRLLGARADRIAGLIKRLRKMLQESVNELKDTQERLAEIGEGLRKVPFDSKARERLLELLECADRSRRGHEISALLSELLTAEKEAENQIHDFIRLHVERPEKQVRKRGQQSGH